MRNAVRMASVRWLLLALAMLMLLGACRVPVKADLAWLYQGSSQGPRVPVILIPGLMGSRLVDRHGNEVWPGSTLRLLTSDYSDLALSLSDAGEPRQGDELRAVGLTDRVAGRDFYASIIETLESAGGYQRTEAGQPPPLSARALYVYPYDWRRDIPDAARGLETLIEQIRRDHGDSTLRVDIVAHSMGGLVARYFLRYGGTDVLQNNDFPLTYAGDGRVRRVLLLGTPNMGSVAALYAFIAGRRVGLGRMHTETLATFPSTFQLFPHAISEWLITADGRPLERDQFDIRIWRRFQWSIFAPRSRARIAGRFDGPASAEVHLTALERNFERNLERARRLVWSLSVPLQRNPWTLVTFGGVCEATPARLLVEEVDGESVVRLSPANIAVPLPGIDYHRLMLEPGDGTVTKSSLLARAALDPRIPRHRYSYFPLQGAMFLCEKHTRLSANPSFQDNLLHFLLSSDPSGVP